MGWDGGGGRGGKALTDWGSGQSFEECGCCGETVPAGCYQVEALAGKEKESRGGEEAGKVRGWTWEGVGGGCE